MAHDPFFAGALTMTTPSLDALDRKILDVLQADGRASNVDLSARVHLSAPQCFRRVRALEERGVIRSYRAEVQPESLGLGVMAYVSLNIDGGQFGRVFFPGAPDQPAQRDAKCLVFRVVRAAPIHHARQRPEPAAPGLLVLLKL